MAADVGATIVEACRAEAHRVMALLEEQLALAVAFTDPDKLDRIFVVHDRDARVHVEDSIFGSVLTYPVPGVACWTDAGLAWLAATYEIQLAAADRSI